MENTENLSTLSSKSIADLARIILKDWGTRLNYAAKPYVEAMLSLETIKDNYILDSGNDIVARFLCNAGSWRGTVAKAVKIELKKRLKV